MASFMAFLTNFCEKALWAQSENGQENQVASQDLVAGVDPPTERLSEAENDSSAQVSPELAQPANDDGFNGKYQPGRAKRGMTNGANNEENNRRRHARA